MLVLQERVARHGDACLGAVALDPSLTIVAVSDGVVEQSGIQRLDLIGRSAIELVHPDDVRRAGEVLEEVLAIPGDRPEGLYRLRVGPDAFRYFTARASNLGEEQGNTVLVEFHEPTKLVRAQAFADDAVDAMRMLSEDITFEESIYWVSSIAERHIERLQLVVTMLSADGENRIYSRSPIPEAIRSVSAAARIDALPVHVESALEELRRRKWRSSRKIASFDYVMPGRLTSIVIGRSGSIVGYVEAVRASTEVPDDAEWLVHGMISRMVTAVVHRYEFDRELRQAADIDALTGLLNRRKLFESLRAAPELAGSLVYLVDLDRFSWVNNNLGHQAGDQTLIAVASALRKACPPGALIARLGGDEFVVWIPAELASHDLHQLGDRISNALVVPAGIGDKRVGVRSSIGMVRISPGELAADALNRADLAMYASKRAGGDCATAG